MARHPLDRVTPPSCVITASSFIIFREFVGNNNSSPTRVEEVIAILFWLDHSAVPSFANVFLNFSRPLIPSKSLF